MDIYFCERFCYFAGELGGLKKMNKSRVLLRSVFFALLKKGGRRYKTKGLNTARTPIGCLEQCIQQQS